MEVAIVTDTSREIPHEYFQAYNIFPLGYYLQDSTGKIFPERHSIYELQTDKLLDIVHKDKNATLFSPTLKDFVELYTFLAEDFSHIISFHSSMFTPVVFENALLAKKLVAEISVDVIDTHTFGCSSGLVLEQLAKAIFKAKSINMIRKESLSLHNRIQSLLATRNDKFGIVGLRKSSWLTNIGLKLKPWSLYHLLHDDWSCIKTTRVPKNLVEETERRIKTLMQAKDLTQVYYYASDKMRRETKGIMETLEDLNLTKTSYSLVSYFLASDEVFDIALI
ncbi:MAG: DegV family protein [Candidatus Heimdallarchaeaceae archaeon]